MTKKHKHKAAFDFEKLGRRAAKISKLMDEFYEELVETIAPLTKAEKAAEKARAKKAGQKLADNLVKASDRLQQMIEKENRRRQKSP